MKILQICNKPPFPPQDGGAIGMHNVTQGLIDSGHQVKVLSVNTPKHFVNINNLPDTYRDDTHIEYGFIDTDLRIKDAFINLVFSKRSYNISRFKSSSFENLLIKVLLKQEFDIVQIESVFLNHYIDIIRKFSKAKIVLRAPNVEHMIWERMANEEVNIFKKFYLKVLSNRLKREEVASLNRFDAIYTVTKNDLELFRKLGCIVPMEFIPTGIDVTKNLDYKSNEIEYPSLFHIGALDWMPNQEGLIWFLRNVWNDLNKKYPDIRFYIAGRGDAAWFNSKDYPNVKLLGEIEDAASFIKSKAIMVVPLFSGSGMRVKIIEGMTLGKAIVSTSIGVEGIIHNHNSDILIANNPNDFTQALSLLIDDKMKYEGVCISAQRTIELNYSNKVLTDKLITFLKSIK